MHQIKLNLLTAFLKFRFYEAFNSIVGSHCHLLILAAQDPWKIKADAIDPNNYYGITVANGMIGIVSSPEPFKVKDVVLAGAYDLYGRAG
jgi:hypothetical protein